MGKTYLKGIDSSKTPSQMDLGFSPFGFSGEIMKGIYRVDGDKLVYCFANAGLDRPDKFEVSEGSGRTLVKLRRYKTGEAEIEKQLRAAEVWFMKNKELDFIETVRFQTGVKPNPILKSMMGLKHLKQLSLMDADDRSVDLIVDHQELYSLGIHGEHLTDEGVAKLAELKSLISLTIISENVSVEAVKQLHGLPLYRFSFGERDREITPAEFEIIVETFPSLTSINLMGTKRTDELLAATTELEKISWIRLDESSVTDQGLEYLANFSQIRQIYARDTAITDEGILGLGQLSELQVLKLDGTQVTDASFEIIANSFPNLRELFVKGVDSISEESLLELKRLDNLKYLRVSKGSISKRATDQLCATIPELRVVQE